MAVYLYTLYVLCLVSIVGLGVDVEARGIHEEPSCSQFNFLEKLLDKQVRIEHSIESFEHKLTEWEDRIKEMLTKLDKSEQQIKIGASEIKKEISDEKSNIEVAMAALGKQQERMSQDLFDQQKDINETLLQSVMNMKEEISDEKSNIEVAMTGLGKRQERMSQDLFDQQKVINETLLQSVENMKESMTTPTVGFKARQVSDTSPSSDDHIIYTVPVVNIGGGYDTTTGEFTVPRDGLYLFTVQMCTRSKKWLYLQIMAADQIIEASTYYDDSATYGTCSSGSGVAVLSTGDKVWVRCHSVKGGTVVSQGSVHTWNTFSGVLIN